MKNIIVMSDSHGMLPSGHEFWQILDESDYIIHLGDGYREIETLKKVYPEKLIYVLGNCDSSTGEPFKIVEIEGIKLLLTHGHKFGVKNDLTELTFECKYQNVRYALYGHTHFAKADEIEGVTLINPGSIGYGRTYCYISIASSKLVYKIVQL